MVPVLRQEATPMHSMLPMLVHQHAASHTLIHPGIDGVERCECVIEPVHHLVNRGLALKDGLDV